MIAGLGTREVSPTASPRICGCASGSTCPTTAPTSTAGRPSPRADGPGHARGRAVDGAASRPRCASSAPVGPTPACTPGARSCTSTSTRTPRGSAGHSKDAARRRWCAGSTASCRRHAGPRRGRGRARFRRPLLGDVAALRLSHRRQPRPDRSVHAAPRALWAHRLDVDAMNEAPAPDRAPGLRGLLQAPRGCHHGAHPDRVRAGREPPLAWSRDASSPTPSATPWCARWSAAW